jgi:hypothetical protein
MIQVTYRNISILVNGKQIQSDKEPASLCFPIHKIGEKVIAYPYAITLKRVIMGKKMLLADNLKLNC